MEYFILRNSKRLINPMKISTHDKYFHVDDGAVRIYTSITDNTSVPDFFCVNKLLENYYFVSEELYELLEDYTDFLNVLITVVSDSDNQKVFPFFKIDLECVDCVQEDEMYGKYKIIEDLVQDKFIFKVKVNGAEFIVVSLHVAEHMLRSNIYGVEYIPVETVRKDRKE